MSGEIIEIERFLTSCKVDEAINHALEIPQAKCEISHFFGPGIYIRQAIVSAGVFAIGQIHRTSCTNVFIKGRVTVIKDDKSTVELVAPMTFVSPPGRNIGYITEDMIWQNIYATDETDIEKLEAMHLDMNDVLYLANKDKKIEVDRTDDLADYALLLEERGMTEEQVREIVENHSDMIPMPYGMYKFTIADSAIQGRGVFAVSDISEGEIIATARINNSRTPIGRYTNHSKNPNAVPRLNGIGGIDIIANRDIQGSRGGFDGEEITLDYRQSQSESTKLDKELACHHLSLHS